MNKGSQAELLESLFFSVGVALTRPLTQAVLTVHYGSRYWATTGAVATAVGGSLRTTDVKKARK